MGTGKGFLPRAIDEDGRGKRLDRDGDNGIDSDQCRERTGTDRHWTYNQGQTDTQEEGLREGQDQLQRQLGHRQWKVQGQKQEQEQDNVFPNRAQRKQLMLIQESEGKFLLAESHDHTATTPQCYQVVLVIISQRS